MCCKLVYQAVHTMNAQDAFWPQDLLAQHACYQTSALYQHLQQHMCAEHQALHNKQSIAWRPHSLWVD